MAERLWCIWLVCGVEVSTDADDRALVERLRGDDLGEDPMSTMREAATAISRLRAENERLRAFFDDEKKIQTRLQESLDTARHHYSEKSAEAHSLRAEVEALRADKERLDWLETDGADVEQYADGSGQPWVEITVQPHNGDLEDLNCKVFIQHTLRAAIDAARCGSDK